MQSKPPPAVFAIALLVGACSGDARVKQTWSAMDAETSATLITTTARGADELVREIRESVDRVAAAVDLEQDDSALSVLNRAAQTGYHRVADDDLYYGIRLALDYARATDGAFDPTLTAEWASVAVARENHSVRFLKPGMALDLDGIAPGLALDVAKRAFSRFGTQGGLLRLGSSVYAWRRPSLRETWNVPLADPRRQGSELLAVRVANRGIAVSALERDGQACVVDPSTGEAPLTDVRVAVAIADGAADADAVSTALVVSGSRGAGALLSKTRRVEAVLVLEQDGRFRVLASASLKGRLELSDALEQETGGDVRYLLPPARL